MVADTASYNWRIRDASSTFQWRALTDGPLMVGGQQVGTASGTSAAIFVIDGIESPFTAEFRCLISNACSSIETASATLTTTSCCDSPDFNCDGDVGTDADIEEFFSCLAGFCPAPPCTNSADFNHDGDTGTDADIESFFRVLAGGSC
jgi:hypothetical protein